MILASKKTVGKRILPLLLAMVLLLLSLPATAFAASLTAVVTADSMAVYADSGLSRQVGSLAEGEIISVERYSGGVAYFRYLTTGGSATPAPRTCSPWKTWPTRRAYSSMARIFTAP